MAFYEKLSVKILKLNDKDLCHIGATSSVPNLPYLIYLNIRLLEMPQNSMIKQRYSFLYSKFTSSSDVFKLFPNKLSYLGFVAIVNRLITRIEQYT